MCRTKRSAMRRFDDVDFRDMDAGGQPDRTTPKKPPQLVALSLVTGQGMDGIGQGACDLDFRSGFAS